jgi:hypothetical protein
MYQLLEFKYMSTYSVNDKHKCGMGGEVGRRRRERKTEAYSTLLQH